MDEENTPPELFQGFKPPHRNTVNRNLKRLKTKHLKRLSDQLKLCQFIGISTDFWTDQKSMSYICITGHFITEKFESRSKVLTFAPYYDRHTGPNIASELELHLKNLKIYEKVVSITCDGASNMRASFNSISTNIRRIICIAHRLHLIVCNSLGLWIKNQNETDEDETGELSRSTEVLSWIIFIRLRFLFLLDDYQYDEDILDNEMRSLSVNNLQDESSGPDHQSDSDQGSSSEGTMNCDICTTLRKSYCFEIDETDEDFDRNSMSNDSWKEGLTTDTDNSTDVQRRIGQTMYQCRSLIKMIKKSSILTSYLDRMKADHKIRCDLSIDCQSRWNSTKQMIDVLLKYRSLISQLHSDKHDLSLSMKSIAKLKNLELSTDQWHLILAMNQALTPFFNATKLISGQKYASIGTCLFAIRKIKQFLENDLSNKPYLNEIKSLLLEQLIHYIDDDLEQHELIQVGLF